MDDMNQGASAAPDASDTDDTGDMSKGFVIEITCTPNGKFSVGVEPISEEAGEESGEGAGDSEDTQAVGSVGEVCKLIREIVAHAGQIADTGADADAMSAGYGSNA